MDQVINWLVKLPAGLVLGAAFLLPLLESSAFVGIAFPGETAVLLAGVVASQGALPLWLVILVASAGAIIGDRASQAAAHRTRECVAATPRRFGRLCWAVHRSTSGAGAGHGGYQPAAVPDVSVVQRRRWHRLGHGSGHCGIHRRKELPGRGTACEHHRLRCTRPGYRRLPLGSPAAAPPGGATGRRETVNRALDGASTDLGESRPREGRAGCSAAFWKTSAITRG